MQLTRSRDIIEVRHVLQPEQCFDFADLRVVATRENLVDMRNYSLDICGAVLRHELPDGLEIAPEVSAGGPFSYVVIWNKD